MKYSEMESIKKRFIFGSKLVRRYSDDGTHNPLFIIRLATVNTKDNYAPVQTIFANAYFRVMPINSQ